MLKRVQPAISQGRRWVWLCILLWVAFFGTPGAQAQEAFRASLAGQEAAAAKKASLANQYYNLKLGPLRLRFSSQLEAEFNDNIALAENNRRADLILRPQIGVDTFWRISEQNTLTLNLGLGYDEYINGTEPSGLFVTPNTDLSLDVYAGDFVINAHDRFAYTRDVENQPQLSGIGSIARIENTSGVGVTWDLNKAILNLTYDHAIMNAIDQSISSIDRSSDLLNAYALFIINPTVRAGIAANGGIVNASVSGASNKQIGAGPMLDVELSDYLSLQASVGYSFYFFDASGTNAASDINALYADLTLRHRVNDAFHYQLSAGRLLQAGLFSETLDLIYARLSTDWNLFHKISFSPGFSYEHVTQPLFATEEADRYIFTFGFGRVITRHLNARVTYYLYLRNSNIENQSYTQNRLVLDLHYAF